MSYVRRVNDVITGGEKARGTVIQAFEFAVNKVGIDINSSDLWNDYLDFLKSWTPAATWEQQQKVDLIRKVFKRCLVIPTEKIETMWSGYTKWENEVNSATASKFIAEKSTEFMDARSWNTEWHNVTERKLRREIVPFSVQENKELISSQLQLWFNWINLEKKNSLNLKDESTVHNRVEYVYKQAIATLPFVPEIWFRYNKFLLGLNEEANLSKCIEISEESILLNPKSFLLSFQLSELYEKDNSFNRATESLNNLIDKLLNDESIITLQIDEKKKNSVNDITNNNVDDNEANNNDNKEDKDEDMENHKSSSVSVHYTEDEANHLIDLEDKQKEYSKLITLVYTKLMMLCKRSQGIKEARAIFKQGRDKFKNLGFNLYTENALMEYYSDKQKTADKVFKLAMKAFGRNGEFLLSYLNYLILTNAVESIKVFFESAVTTLLKDVNKDKEDLTHASIDLFQRKNKTRNIETNQFYMKKIIKKYMRFATNYLDIDTVRSLENRYEQFFPEEDPLDLFADRYKSSDFNVIRRYDLGEDSADEELDLESARQTKRRKIDSAQEDNYSPEASVLNENQTKPIQAGQDKFVGDIIYNLLQVLPNAGYFGPPAEHVFNSSKLVELFSNLPDLPDE